MSTEGDDSPARMTAVRFASAFGGAIARRQNRNRRMRLDRLKPGSRFVKR
jgi:hypothetical protein